MNVGTGQMLSQLRSRGYTVYVRLGKKKIRSSQNAFNHVTMLGLLRSKHS